MPSSNKVCASLPWEGATSTAGTEAHAQNQRYRVGRVCTDSLGKGVCSIRTEATVFEKSRSTEDGKMGRVGTV